MLETPLRLFWPKEPSLQETPCLGSEQPQGAQFSHAHQGRAGASEGCSHLSALPSWDWAPSVASPASVAFVVAWKGAGATLAGEGPPGHAGFHGGAGAVLEAGGSRAWWVMSRRVEPGDPRPDIRLSLPRCAAEGDPGGPALPPRRPAFPPLPLFVQRRAPLAGPSAPARAHTAAGPWPGPSRGLLSSQLGFL